MNSDLAQRRPGTGSFTLVELLVVIAIIALLATVLLPSLKSARDSAYSAQCKNNLRQIDAAVFFYLDDNQGFFFPAYYGGYSNNPAPYNDFEWEARLISTLGVPVPAWALETIRPIYRCEAHRRGVLRASANGYAGWTFSFNGNRSMYSYNADLGPLYGVLTYNLNALTTPGSMIVMMDGIPAVNNAALQIVVRGRSMQGYMTGAGYDPKSIFFPWHQASYNNAAFCDGHVASVLTTQIVRSALTPH